LAKPRNTPPPAPIDTAGQKAAARGLLLLGAAVGVALVLGGAWVFSLAFTGTHLLTTRAGIGFVMMGLGAIGCWAGLYASRHSQLENGKLRFDKEAHALLSSPLFVRYMKAAGHAAGITLLAVSWLAVYYPQGVSLR